MLNIRESGLKIKQSTIQINKFCIYNMKILEQIRIRQSPLISLIGAVLIKVSTSITACWGNINLYFLSLFHYQGTKITPQTNSLILLISVIPMIIALIFSTKLCNKFGYQIIIRFCSFIFLITPLTNIFVLNVYTFTIFSIIIPGSMFALGSVPILNSMWTQFPESKNKVTAILVIFFGIGGITWNLIFSHLINPNNQVATAFQNISFFSQNVTMNVQKTAIGGYLAAGILSVIGSLLIKRKSQAEEQRQVERDIQAQNENKQQICHMGLDNEAKIISSNSIIKNSQALNSNLTFKQALKTEHFQLILLISFLTGLYQIHLMMNFKIIFLAYVNDDHFLSYCIIGCSIVSIVGAFFWGYLGDRKGVSFTILLLSILDIGSKIFSDFAVERQTIIVMVILIGLISKSMTTLAGPGFVQFYGLKLGTELLPFKGVSILIGYILVPFLQLLTSSYMNPRQYLIFISFASVLTLYCSIKLFKIDPKNRNKLKEIQNEKINVESDR